jgi:hypothetical protein
MSIELTDLDIDEVSLVDAPANKRRFLLIKRRRDHRAVTKQLDLATLADRAREIVRESSDELSIDAAVMRALDEDAEAKAAFLASGLDVKALAARIKMLPRESAAAEVKTEKGATAMTYAQSVFEHRVRPIAAAIRKRRPELTEAQAITEALATREGGEAYAEMRSRDAHLTTDEVIEKRRGEARLAKALVPFGATHPDEAVANLAKAHSPKDIAAGLEWVRKNAPNLWAAYIAQRNHAYA